MLFVTMVYVLKMAALRLQYSAEVMPPGVNLTLLVKVDISLLLKATTGDRNANFHTTSLPPLVALTIIVET